MPGEKSASKKTQTQRRPLPTGLTAENLQRYKNLVKIGTQINKDPGFIPLNPNHDLLKSINANLQPSYGYFCLSSQKNALTLVYYSKRSRTIVEKKVTLEQHAQGILVDNDYIFITSKNHERSGYNLRLDLGIKEYARGQTVLEDIARRNNVFLIYNLAPNDHLVDNEFPLTEEHQNTLVKIFNKTASAVNETYQWPLAIFVKGLFVPFYFWEYKYLTAIEAVDQELFFLCLQSQQESSVTLNSKNPPRKEYFLLSTHQIKQMLPKLFTLEEKTKYKHLQYGFFKSSPLPKRDDFLLKIATLPTELKKYILSYVYGNDYDVLKNLTLTSDKSFLLYHAAIFGQEKMIDRLVRSEVDLEHGDSQGRIPLHIAVINGHYDENLLLLLTDENKRLINCYDHQKHTAFYHAALSANTNAIKPLVRFGATARVVISAAEYQNVLVDIINDIKNYSQLHDVLKAINAANLEMNCEVLDQCQKAINKKDFPEEQKQALSDLLIETPSLCHTM